MKDAVRQGWLFILLPVGVCACIICAVGAIWNNLFAEETGPGSPYPAYWFY